MRWLLIAMLFGCGGTATGDVEACTVEDHGDGTATLTCPDGTTAEIGAPAVPDDTDTSTEALPCGPVTIVHDDYVARNDIDLALLRCVGEVTGTLMIEGTGVTSLSDLAALTRVGGSLFIYDNLALTSLSGLDALSVVGDGMAIRGNASLTSLSGLGALTSTVAGLAVYDNVALASLSGLDDLTTVGDSLAVYDNPALCQSQVDELDGRLTATCDSCSGNRPGC